MILKDQHNKITLFLQKKASVYDGSIIENIHSLEKILLIHGDFQPVEVFFG